MGRTTLKKLFALLALLMSVFAFAACGSDSESEVTPENLASAMDEVCADFQDEFDAMGVRGLTNPQVVLEIEGATGIRQQVVEGLGAINADDEAREQLDAYIAASKKVIAGDKAVIEAAAADDTEAVNKAFEEQTKAFDGRDAVAEEIGTEVCGQVIVNDPEPSGTEPPADLEYAEPKNTVEEAADEFVAAMESGNCQRINSIRHSDAGTVDKATCNQIAENFTEGTVKGTESYGPVGQAEIDAGGVRYPTFFVEDTDGVLRYGGDAINDNGGLRPAPEGNDAQETIDAAFAAIRDNDGAAFNATLPDESSGFWLEDEGKFETFSEGGYNEAFVKDVRDTDGEPVQLGLNSTFGFYYYEGSENDWVITAIHIPGTGAHYRFSGYWPVPKP